MSVTTPEDFLAAIDVGTNTVLLLTAVPDGHGGIREVTEAARTTRLGEGIDRTGSLLPAAIDRTLTAVLEFTSLAQRDAAHGTGIAAATSALRDASNRHVFLEQWQTRIGGSPALFSGDDEARTSFRGIASDQDCERFLVGVDIGGGSTELTAGVHGRLLGSVSLDAGCVRFGERFGLLDVSTADAHTAARAAAAQLLRPAARGLLALGPPGAAPHVVVCGGTATTYAAMRLGLHEWDRTRVHGFSADLPGVGAAVSMLAAMRVEARAELPGISRGRAAVLPAGLLILIEVLNSLGTERFTVTTRGLRYGMLCRLQTRELLPTWTW